MAGIKTGKGGFDIDDKVYSFDVGDPNEPGSDLGIPDAGDLRVDNSVKDISKKTRATLGQYLSDVTKGKKGSSKGTSNRYTIEPPSSSTSVDEISISTNKGVPTTLSSTSNDDHFVDRSSTSGVTAGPSGDPATALTDLSKGKQDPLKTDGHTLLQSVGVNNPGPIIGGYTSKVLAMNRFTADGAKLSNEQSYMIHGINASSNMMKSVGVMLSLRGSQEFPAAFKDGVNPQNAGSVAGALIPSPNQLGILKVSKVLLEAQDALEHITSGADAPTEITISPMGDQSWGALNNVEEPWSGTLNLGMIAMALALQVAMLLAFEGLGMLIGLVGGGSGSPSVSRKPDGTYTKGSYLEVPLANPNNVGFPPNIKALLGIHGTIFPFGDALKTGAAAFFVGGDKAKEGLGSQLVGALKSAASSALSDNSSAGFLIIVSRQIIRVGQVIAAQIKKISSAFASNPISGIKGIIGLLDIIKQSKLIAAINIFTTLGDAILSEDEYTKDQSADSSEKSAVSTIDAFDDNAVGANVKKNRLKKSTQKTKLAWSSNRAPAAYLLPDSIATMTLVDTKLGSFKGPMGTSDPDSKGVIFVQTESDRQQNGSRLPRQSTDADGVDVKKMEALLEAEYMPFYFHDLRTNEVIGFQAFLAALSDDYQVNWETVDGYGRVDPVKIYKSTGRRIGMSFYVIATSEPDFDEMWLKLNKLVTMVYPQYTKGRLLTDGSSTAFTQPFSQLIGASPLIRIRLGDLIRSNYSRFALARLFGAADNDTKLNGSTLFFEGAKEIIANMQKALENAQNDSENEWHLKTVGYPAAMASSAGGPSLGFGGPSNPDQASNLNIEAGDLPYFVFKVKKKINDETAKVEPSLMSTSEMSDLYGYSVDDASFLEKDLKKKYESSDSITTKVIGGKAGYAVPYSMLTLTAKSFKKILSDSGGKNAIENIDALTEFLDINKNALVKSFNTIQGKGLAGVIETMNFDWYDKVTWETKPGMRAPKMCKVTLTFGPIHDISPGIDHLGYNRAPVYPVGKAMGIGFDPDKSG